MKPFSTEPIKFKVNNIDIDGTLLVFCEQDDLTLDDVIGDLENREELERKINRGDLMIAYVRVEVRALGLEGFYSIGGCYISKPEDVLETVEAHGMRSLALDHFREVARVQYDLLKPVFSEEK